MPQVHPQLNNDDPDFNQNQPRNGPDAPDQPQQNQAAQAPVVPQPPLPQQGHQQGQDLNGFNGGGQIAQHGGGQIAQNGGLLLNGHHHGGNGINSSRNVEFEMTTFENPLSTDPIAVIR